jgi:hypothetical protein
VATTLTPNALLQKPATADRNWDVPLNANADFLDGVAAVGRLLVTPAELPSATLNVRVTAGTYAKSDGTVGSFAGISSYALTASTSTALWLTDAGQLSSGADFPAVAHVRLARVVSGAATVLSVSDERVVARTCAGVGGSTTFQVDPVAHTVAFFGATPATQATAIVSLADGTTGTASNTVADVGPTYSQAQLDNNFAALTAKVNALIAALKRYGLLGN